jgi:hypothetical protein
MKRWRESLNKLQASQAHNGCVWHFDVQVVNICTARTHWGTHYAVSGKSLAAATWSWIGKTQHMRKNVEGRQTIIKYCHAYSCLVHAIAMHCRSCSYMPLLINIDTLIYLSTHSMHKTINFISRHELCLRFMFTGNGTWTKRCAGSLCACATSDI